MYFKYLEKVEKPHKCHSKDKDVVSIMLVNCVYFKTKRNRNITTVGR